MDNISTRAARNRTLVIDECEIQELEKQIKSVDDIKQSFALDCVINADLFDCIDNIPNGLFNLIILDPPYNLDKDFCGRKFSRMKPHAYEDYLNSWFFKVCDKLAPNGTLYMCGDWKCSSSMQHVIEQRLTIINRITWQREKGRGAKANWKNAMEDIWFAVNDPNDYYFNVEAVKLRRKVIAPYKINGQPKDWFETDFGNFRNTHPSNFWDDISVPFWSMPENTNHPTQKPEKLIAKLILASSRPGDIVFDPFLGSGTTAVVAHKLGRRYCGIEINREFCLWTAKRMMRAESDKTIQGYADGVFWERNSLATQHKTTKKLHRY